MTKEFKYKDCDVSIHTYQSPDLPNDAWAVRGQIIIHAQEIIMIPFTCTRYYQTEKNAEDDFEAFATRYIDTVILSNFRPHK